MSGIFAFSLLLAPACYPPPISAPVTDPFRAPPCAQCAGNRGLEYEPPSGTRVTAVAPGTVTFAGSVAGTRYVVIEQPDGLRATYGRLATIAVVAGAHVAALAVVGTTTDRFFFGIRRGDSYLDPAPMLGRLRYRPRLIPDDGRLRRAAPPPSLSCPAHA